MVSGPRGWIGSAPPLSLVREIVGDETPVDAVDYDACLRTRTVLARLPANRTKLYGDLPIDQAIARAAKDGKPLLAPVTQERYLAALQDILDLVAKKRLINVNPAEGLRPIKRDAVAASDKRKPFTLEQIAQFFKGDFYAECAKHTPPFRGPIPDFLRCSTKCASPILSSSGCSGIFRRLVTVFSVLTQPLVASSSSAVASISRYQVPFSVRLRSLTCSCAASFGRRPRNRHSRGSQKRQPSLSWARLFQDLKPDSYGNYATYALKRFRETYLPDAVKMEARQSFYSFRHSWRDALRRIDAQPATLQALGAWSQGKLTSDDYGDKADPDYQVQFMQKISFTELDLSPFHLKSK
jgi:hypothetical protein